MNSVKGLVGTALIWPALSALIWVPTSSAGSARTTVVAILGFAAFAAALALLAEGLKQSIVDQLRKEWRREEVA